MSNDEQSEGVLEQRSFIFRLAEKDMVTLLGVPGGNTPPRTLRVIDHLKYAVGRVPLSRLIEPSPEDGIHDLWEVKVQGDEAYILMKLHLSGTDQYRV